jgi:hypothetical protein
MIRWTLARATLRPPERSRRERGGHRRDAPRRADALERLDRATSSDGVPDTDPGSAKALDSVRTTTTFGYASRRSRSVRR